jgi:hypothetical protein
MKQLASVNVVHDFNQLLSNSTGPSAIYTHAQSVNNTVVRTVAHSILGLVMLVQLVKISQRIDASATLPAIKDVVFLGVFYVIFFWLINNSFEVCGAVFEGIESISKNIAAGGNFSATLAEPQDAANLPVQTLLILVLVSILMYIVGLVAWIVAYFVFYARAILLYVMAAFAPIPLAMLGFEDTRSFGINFCRNFISTCLAGAIMVFLLMAFPLVITTVISGQPNVSLIEENVQLNIIIIQILALSILLIAGLLKTGSWAREIMGG